MDVRLPNLGEGVDSGSVVTLFVKEGDVITKGQTLLDLENEKAVAPIPSPAEGRVVVLRVKAGDKLSVGQVILTLASAGVASAAAPEQPRPAVPQAQASSAPAPSEPGTEIGPETEDEQPTSNLASHKAGFPPPASPSIRKLAKDLGIDLSKVRGSEHGGRIVLGDLRLYIQRLQQLASQQNKKAPAVPVVEPVDFSKWGPVSTKPMSVLRQVISRRMTESWSSIPHVTQFDVADLSRITQLRKQYGPAYEASGTRLTVTSFVLKALATLLKKHPLFNASLDEPGQKIVFKEYIHIGLAVDTDAGLLVPVIRDVDAKPMLELSREIQGLADKARERKLSLEDMKGGSFTVSNQGGIGGAHFTPIINKPEVAILGVGKGAMQPVVRDSQIVARPQLPLALSYDHRLIDGGNAARFMVELVGALESFAEQAVKL